MCVCGWNGIKLELNKGEGRVIWSSVLSQCNSIQLRDNFKNSTTEKNKFIIGFYQISIFSSEKYIFSFYFAILHEIFFLQCFHTCLEREGKGVRRGREL